MKKKVIKPILVIFVLVMLVSACGGGDSVSDADAVLTQAAEIAVQGLTQTAEAVPPATDTPLPAPTDTPTLQPVVSPTTGIAITGTAGTPGTAAGSTPPVGGSPTQFVLPATSTPASIQATASGDCYKAAFETEGAPFDGTRITGGKIFTKTWRIKNIGTCEWGEEVYLKWVGTEKTELNQPTETGVAELFGQGSVIPIITETIYPGEHLNIVVDFTVPVPRTTHIRWKAYYILGTPGGLVNFDGGTIWFDIIATNPD